MRRRDGARHLERRQIDDMAEPPTGARLGWWLLGAGLLVGISGALASVRDPVPPVDRLSNSDIVEFISPANRQRMQSFAAFDLDEVERELALANLHLTESQLKTVRQALSAKKPQRRSRYDRNQPEAAPGDVTSPDAPFRLVQFKVSDSHANDGDALTFSTRFYSVDVPLSHKPVTVTLLLDAQATMQVTGLRDGGHGITAAIEGIGETLHLLMFATQQISVRVKD